MLEKAQDFQKIKNLETGTKHKSSFAFESTTNLLQKASIANISLGIDTCNQLERIELLKQKELANRREFEESRPETTLPANLDSVLVCEDFPPLVCISDPLKDQLDGKEQSWVRVASKSCDKSPVKLRNDRSSMEY